MEKRQDCPCILSVHMKDLPACPAALYVNDSLAGTAQRDSILGIWVYGGSANLVAVSGAVPADDLLVWSP